MLAIVVASTMTPGNATAETPLQLQLTRPLSSQTLFATEPLEAIADAGLGITRVEFLVDGIVVGAAHSPPYSATWNTATVPDGAHTIAVRAVLPTGQTISGPAVAVTVNNALTSDQRISADLNAGYIAVDQAALYGLYAYGAPLRLPERYRSTNAGDGHPAARVATYLADWGSLEQSTRDEIMAFASQPDRGEHFESPSTLSVGIATPAFPGCNIPRADGGFECNLTTEHFSIKYHISDDPDDTGDVPHRHRRRAPVAPVAAGILAPTAFLFARF